jgi:quercetin 2,3-dioxygenase
MLQVRSSPTLDGGDFGWLKARHHFAVTGDGNLANGPLGALVVWNDDEIAPGIGFGPHGHADMEIVSYVREGTVTHRDSLGNTARRLATRRRSAPARAFVTPSTTSAPSHYGCFRSGSGPA